MTKLKAKRQREQRVDTILIWRKFQVCDGKKKKKKSVIGVVWGGGAGNRIFAFQKCEV